MRAIISDGNCLCNRPSGVTTIEIVGQRIGLSGVEELFRRWQILDREPSDLVDKDILTELRGKNFASDAVKYAHVEAVRALRHLPEAKSEGQSEC